MTEGFRCNSKKLAMFVAIGVLVNEPTLSDRGAFASDRQDQPFAKVYFVDPGHSSVVFRIRHFDMADVYGTFDVLRGEYRLDSEDLGKSSVNVVVDAGSISTRHKQRDGHLRGAAYLKTGKFAEISFQSTKVEHMAGNRFRVTGDLNLLGKTQPLTVEIVQSKPMWLARINGFLGGIGCEFSIDRTSFGMQHKKTLGDEVKLLVSLEAADVRADEE